MIKTTRRTALKGLIAGGASPFVSKAFSAGAPSPVRSARTPNILFIMVDQLHHRALSALGNRHVHTPNIDRLIKSGTSFETCYCAAPICIPCRATLISGRMPSETGVWINTVHQQSKGRIERNIPTIGEWLRTQKGYETVYAGKYHVPVCNTYNIPGFDVIAAGTEHLGEPGDSGVARACEAWLHNYDPAASSPFFMVCSLVNPHDICHWLSVSTTHDPDRLSRYPHLEKTARQPPLPPNFAINGLVEPDVQKTIRRQQQPAGGEWQENDWRYYLWSYYRLVEMVDGEIGRVLDALEATGLAENTLVVFTSDHGEGMGELQMVRKAFLYDSATRVPLIFSMPGRIAANQMNTDCLTGSIDLFPTFCDFAGVSVPPNLNHAQSLFPVLTGNQKEPPRPVVVTEFNDLCRNQKNANSAGRLLRTKQYKYITYYDQPVQQLFDMKNDPGETVNLAEKSEYASILKEHRRLLEEWEKPLVSSQNVHPSPWKQPRPDAV